MRTLLLVLCLAAGALAVKKDIDDSPNMVCAADKTCSEDDDIPPYHRFIEFPDGDGMMHPVDLEEKPDMELIDAITTNPELNNKYLLYTRSNRNLPQKLIINDVNSIQKSNFKSENPTIVIVHGWLSNQNTGINPTIKNAYLGKSDTNVIVLDWRRLAGSTYATAVRGVPAVGRGLGQFLAFLNTTTGAHVSSMHLIGFSLGGHVVGNAGRELGGKVARITGLDPAGPLWHLNPEKLKSTDAVYVEAIHTNRGHLGINANVGDVDFYPNGGASQPGCDLNVCDHNRAWEFFASTVKYNHLIGKNCSNKKELNSDTCRGKELAMGNEELWKSGSGMYRLNTRSTYPY